MRDAKKGQFYLTEGQRSMANNSAVYNSKPSAEEFLMNDGFSEVSLRRERILTEGDLRNSYQLVGGRQLKNERQIGLNPCGENLSAL